MASSDEDIWEYVPPKIKARPSPRPSRPSPSSVSTGDGSGRRRRRPKRKPGSKYDLNKPRPKPSRSSQGDICQPPSKPRSRLVSQLGKEENLTTAFCPNCQLPFHILNVQTPVWHVDQCLQMNCKSDIKECPRGLDCGSTSVVHYKNFTHKLLAYVRAGGDPDDYSRSLISNVEKIEELFTPRKNNVTQNYTKAISNHKNHNKIVSSQSTRVQRKSLSQRSKNDARAALSKQPSILSYFKSSSCNETVKSKQTESNCQSLADLETINTLEVVHSSESSSFTDIDIFEHNEELQKPFRGNHSYRTSEDSNNNLIEKDDGEDKDITWSALTASGCSTIRYDDSQDEDSMIGSLDDSEDDIFSPISKRKIVSSFAKDRNSPKEEVYSDSEEKMLISENKRIRRSLLSKYSELSNRNDDICNKSDDMFEGLDEIDENDADDIVSSLEDINGNKKNFNLEGINTVVKEERIYIDGDAAEAILQEDSNVDNYLEINKETGVETRELNYSEEADVVINTVEPTIVVKEKILNESPNEETKELNYSEEVESDVINTAEPSIVVKEEILNESSNEFFDCQETLSNSPWNKFENINIKKDGSLAMNYESFLDNPKCTLDHTTSSSSLGTTSSGHATSFFDSGTSKQNSSSESIQEIPQENSSSVFTRLASQVSLDNFIPFKNYFFKSRDVKQLKKCTENGNSDSSTASTSRQHSNDAKGQVPESSKTNKKKTYQWKQNNFTHNPNRHCPFYKKMPDTPFAVDAFSYGTVPGIKAYFLSHFHADHYGGLTRHFQHLIYCSKETGNLVKLKIGVAEKFINMLPLNTPCLVEDVKVTLLPANHCPGAVLILFQLKCGKVYLHTGDFRADPSMEDYPALSNCHIHTLYLDTTYCSPEYQFPIQKDTVQYTVDIASRHVRFNERTLIVCGTYTIGKEKIFLAIAKALGCKVCISREKESILKCLEDEELNSYLTRDKQLTRLHVLPMASITHTKLKEYMSQFSKQYTQVIGIKPTGWTHSKKAAGLLDIKPSVSGSSYIYGVPYSEHSSYNELERFVRFIKADKIVPTVNIGTEASRKKMANIFSSWMKGEAMTTKRKCSTTTIDSFYTGLKKTKNNDGSI